MIRFIKYYLILTFFLFNSCKKVNDTKNDYDRNTSKVEISDDQSDSDKGIEFLKKFYFQYMSAFDTKDGHKRNRALIQKNISQELQNKIELADLDYDPIIDAQDVNTESIKTISVESKGNDYKVCYISTFSGKDVCINLVLEMINNEYIINDIKWNDDLNKKVNDSLENSLINIKNFRIYEGDYENGLKMNYNRSNQKIEGIINYRTTSKCSLRFFGYFENVKNEIPIQVKESDNDDLLNGILFLKDKFVLIKFNAPSYCQRVLDFKNGETFFKK